MLVAKTSFILCERNQSFNFLSRFVEENHKKQLAVGRSHLYGPPRKTARFYYTKDEGLTCSYDCSILVYV